MGFVTNAKSLPKKILVDVRLTQDALVKAHFV